MQLGREPHLGIHDPVGGQVLGAFGGDPAQRLRGLHHPDRVPEGVQVNLQVTAVRTLGEPLGQLFFVVRGQVVVARFLRQFEDRPRPQAAVQVVVQQDLRDGPDLGKCRHLPILLRGTDFGDDRGDRRGRSLVADLGRALQRGQGRAEALRLVGAELEQRLAGLHRLSRLDQADDARGHADVVFLARPARAGLTVLGTVIGLGQ